MTLDLRERLRFYLQQTRLEYLRASQNSSLNGYKAVAAEEENKAQLAKLLLDDLATEHGVPDAR